MRTFVTKCVVGDIVTEGEGNGKKVNIKDDDDVSGCWYDGGCCDNKHLKWFKSTTSPIHMEQLWLSRTL